ncbi:MAG: tandem-95 repeat protein, partial [Planctomycetes bacterium]|nr:tandem-95 repeat protein [Planctomycetota bacterium]
MTPLKMHGTPRSGSGLLPAKIPRTRKALLAPVLLALVGLPGLFAVHDDLPNTLTLTEDASATAITLTGPGTNYTVLTQPAKGSLAGLPGGAFAGSVSGTYTPSANANGSDSFTFRTIEAGVSRTYTFSITINAVNDAPVAVIPVVETLAGRDWVARAGSGSRAWQAIATSSNGSLLAAAVDGGQIYISVDYGETWAAKEENRNWQAIASSSDGSKLVATVDGGQIYTSVNSGATWAARDASRNWKSVASSADGQKLVAANYGGKLYTSTDTGATWVARDSDRPWYAVASSSSGGTLAAAVYGGAVYTSVDSGINWVARTSGAKLWSAVASSADGQKLVAAEVNGLIHTSSDGGTNWVAQAGSGARFWTSVASSADGLELIASAYGGKLYTSADSGVTWVERDEARLWFSVAASADGGRLAAVTDGGVIYTSIDVNAPSTITVAEDSGAYANASFFSTLNAGPNESDQSVTISVSADVQGLFSVQPAFLANGALTFTPAPNANGTAILTIASITDSAGASSVPTPTNKVMVKITAVADAPTQGPITIAGLEDTVVTFAANSFASGYNLGHVDGASARAAVSYTFETLPSLGVLKLSGALLAVNQSVPVASLGNVTFEPALNQSGSTSFRVSVSDGLLSSGTGANAALVTINISAANDAPFSVAQSVSTLEDTAVPITLTGTDPDANTLTYSIVSQPTKGSLSGTAPTISYTPGANFFGSDSFTFKVNDGIVDSAVSTVSITVVAVNDPPTLGNVFVAGLEDSLLTFNRGVFEAVYSDSVEANAFASLKVVSLPQTGTLKVGGAAATAGQEIAAADLGTLTYTPATDENGAKIFSVRAIDSGGASSANATVTMVLSAANDTPTLGAVKFELDEDTSVVLSSANFAAKFNDPDGQPFVGIKVLSLPTAGTLKHGATNAAEGLELTAEQIAGLSYSRAANENGEATFTVSGSDGGSSSGPAVVTLSVVPVNDAPSATIPTVTQIPAGDTLNVVAGGAPASANWKALAASANASTLVGVVDNGQIYVSSDSGANWTARETARNWSSVSISTNGQVIAASVFRGKIHVSTDAGANWTARESDRTWRSVSISTNGAVMAAVANLGQVYVSVDSGATWTARATSQLWNSIAVSADGSRMVASVYGGTLYTSADKGTNWTSVASPRLWNSVAASPDGLKLVATEVQGSIWQSADGGATWTANTAAGSRNWSSVAISADGSRLIAGVAGGKLVRSLDGGATWKEVGTAQNWSSVVGSLDLKTAVAAVDGGSVSKTVDYTIPLTITVDEDSGVYTQAGFATGASAGPSNESSQVISYTVAVSNLSYTGGTNLFVGTPTVDANGALSFVPAPNATGSATLTVSVKDNGGTTNVLNTVTGVDTAVVGSFSVVVSPVDDAPTATAQTVGVVEDTASNAITLAGNDVENQALSFELVTQPTKGTLGGTAPALTYTPTLNLTGADSFTFRVVAGGLPSSVATVSIVITNVNDAPVAVAQVAQPVVTDEDTAKAITLVGTDVEGSTLTYTVVTPPTKGTLSGTAPALTYTPNANISGNDSFTFKVNDGTTDSAPATVSIRVDPVNDIPTAISLTGTSAIAAIEDSATNFSFTLGGSSPEGRPLTYQVLTLPTKGSLSQGNVTLTKPADLLSNPALGYKPSANVYGSDSFTFKVNDGSDNSAVATVAINITNVNDIPSFTIPTVLKVGGDKAAWDVVADSQANWNDLDVSSNGKVVVAVGAAAFRVSNDGGVTFGAPGDVPGSGGYNAVALSADGSKGLVARGTGLHILSGVTWFTPSAPASGLPALGWIAVASSADGTKLAAAAPNAKVYVSVNSGTNWTAVGAARDWEALASSADGTKLAAAEYNGLIYTSTDGGATWTGRGTANRYWTAVASSSDGMKLAATEMNGKIYISEDGGATWTTRESARAWSSIAMSADGKVMVAGAYGDKLYYSNDSGANWTSKDQARVWRAVGVSGDGSNAIAAVLGGSLYRAAGYITESTITVEEDAVTSIANFATQISVGTGDPEQTVSFVVSNNNTNLFKAGPAISPDGTLTFTPADNLFGAALVSVFIQDNGGTALGGVDKSAAKIFNIAVTPVNDAPVANAQTVSAVEDTAKAITLTGTDAEGSALT